MPGVTPTLRQMLWNWNTVDACFISSTWRITSDGMFAGSCIGVICLVMCLEALRRLQREYDAYLVRQYRKRNESVGTVSWRIQSLDCLSLKFSSTSHSTTMNPGSTTDPMSKPVQRPAATMSQSHPSRPGTRARAAFQSGIDSFLPSSNRPFVLSSICCNLRLHTSSC